METPHVVQRAGTVLAAAVVPLALAAPAALAVPPPAPAVTAVTPAGQSQPAAHAIPFTEAAVTQHDDGSYSVNWRAQGVQSVTVYADGRQVARGGAEESVTVRGLPAADRQWFRLVPDRGDPLTLADRSLHLASAPNFRDAGGYRTSGGQWVRMGVLYRTGQLSKLTDADVAKLQRLGIRTDYDLRAPGERAKAPDRIPQGTRYVVADVTGEDVDLPATAEQAAELMTEGNRAYVSRDSARKAYGALFRDAANPSAYALAYHCTAGKDRTGWASAALLTALGVDRGTVMRDYLATNEYRADEVKEILDQATPHDAAILKPVIEARTGYLDASFDEVERRYGTFENYLHQGLGLDDRTLAGLRKALLTD
ncbi:tyrosine-protein phosphatase [Streptomyces sp. ET3-23]|uniref:tyrosine-protein phosphatase n=1 Tax=Streptomyces sp. ET3-23 TaxID=2885643 RepID=UPI001D10125D|nr:tyrosine-protein phosphatase [Streptomyces sp. ET3-23]MCC2279913.1 tyrosine-protein phosphatase [Streptomyces sp. ET3-23]